MLDRVVLVHEHGQGIHGNRNSSWLVAILLFEGSQFGVLHLAAHRAQVGGAFGQRRWRGGGASSLDLDIYVRVFLLVGLGPQGHQVCQGIGTNAGQIARYASGLGIARDSRVDSGNRVGGRNASGDKGHCRHQTLQFHALLLADRVVWIGPKYLQAA
ncbi:hypothetical protein D3C80_1432590 [compost metagenome]